MRAGDLPGSYSAITQTTKENRLLGVNARVLESVSSALGAIGSVSLLIWADKSPSEEFNVSPHSYMIENGLAPEDASSMQQSTNSSILS